MNRALDNDLEELKENIINDDLDENDLHEENEN